MLPSKCDNKDVGNKNKWHSHLEGSEKLCAAAEQERNCCSCEYRETVFDFFKLRDLHQYMSVNAL